jgi:hypothetical protein
VLAEIQNGNVNSREFTFFMIGPANPPGEYDPKRIEEHTASYRREHLKRADQFVSTVFELTQSDSTRTRDWALEYLVTWCEHFEIDTSKTPGVRKRLEEELSSKNPQKVSLAARFLARAAPDSPGLVTALTKLLEERGYQSSALAFLRQLGPKAAAATPTLVRMLTSVLKDGYYVKRPSASGFFGGDSSPGVVSISLVIDVLKTIGSIGPAAGEALPLLEEVARDPMFIGSKTLSLREPANEAIARIRGTTPKESAKPKETPKKPLEKSKITSTPDGPTYDGKTFGEWLAVVETERNPLRLSDPVRSMAYLANGDKAEVAARAIFRLMRSYYSRDPSFALQGK